MMKKEKDLMSQVILCDGETYLNPQLRAVQLNVTRQRLLSPCCSVFPRRPAAAVRLHLAGCSSPFGSPSEPFLVHWSGPGLLHLTPSMRPGKSSSAC